MSTPFLLALFFFAASNAFGQINPAVLYNITAKHSHKCLDVTGGATGNGVRVIQWECNGGVNQKWKFTPVADGYYKIEAANSGKALDVFGGLVSLGNGVIVEQWDYNGGANQMWKLESAGDSYYRIVAKHSGKSLDIDGASTANGAGAQQWQSLDGDNQKFSLTALGTRPTCASDQTGSTLTNGTAELIANRVSGLPFVQTIDLTVDFTQCRAQVHIANLQPVVTREYDTSIGRNTTTVTLTAGGNGELDAARRLSVQVTLHFTHSLAADPRTAAQAAPSDLTLTLTGSVAPNGDVALAGSARFVGGYLGGSAGVLRVTGRLSPNP